MDGRLRALLAELLEYWRQGRRYPDAQPEDSADAGALVSCPGEQVIPGITGFQADLLRRPKPVRTDEAALAERFAGEVAGHAEPGRQTHRRPGVRDQGRHGGGRFRLCLFGALAWAARERRPGDDPQIPASPLPLLDFPEERGVAPRVLLPLRSTQSPKIRPICWIGVLFVPDSINRPKYLSHEAELDLIVSLLRRGYTDRLLLSLDTTAARLRAYGAKDMGLDYILRDFRIRLARRGVTEEEWDRLTRLNALSLMIDESEEAIL